MKNHTTDTAHQGMDFGSIVNQISKKWYLFAGFLAGFVIVAFMYIKLTTSTYSINSSMLINIPQPMQQRVDPNDFLQQGNMLFEQSTDLNNEMLVLSSTPLIVKSIIKLGMQVDYFHKKNFLFYENQYTSSPFYVKIDNAQAQPVDVKFKLYFSGDNKVRIVGSGSSVKLFDYTNLVVSGRAPEFKIDTTVYIGSSVTNKNCSFTILLKDNKKASAFANDVYAFVFNDVNSYAGQLQSRLIVTPVDPRKSTVVTIDFSAPNAQMGKDFMNSMLDEYLQKNLDKKNYLARNTIEYIDKQLGEVSDSLSITESNLQNFRSSNEVMDIGIKTQRIYEQLQQLENERASVQVRLKYYYYIQEYFTQSKDITRLMAPSSAGVSDPILNSLIQQMSDLYRQKIEFETNNQQKSPHYKNVTEQIENLNNTILENIRNIINTSEIELDDYNSRLANFQGQIQQLPSTQRELFGFERKFRINDEIYTYLLQRRSEAEIAKASNLPDNEIIEPVRVLAVAWPNPLFIFPIAILLGLLIPVIWVFGKTMFIDTIQNKHDIAKITDYAFLGNIFHNSRNENQVLLRFPKSGVSESFRMVRTNLNFFTQGKSKQIILVTSSFGGEGKSFNTINIATSYALNGNRTLLIDFDLRKPTIHEKLELKNRSVGVTSYLIDKAVMEDIIIPSNIDNLDVILAGEIPPNPSELIASEKTREMLETLRENYEYIIIDSPPVGIVTDAILLMQYADLNVYITRQNHTKLKEFQNVIHDIETKEIKHLAIVLNDFRYEDAGTGYGYYSKYGGSKKYYEEGETKKKKKTPKSKKKTEEVNEIENQEEAMNLL